jgi:hypothetical protein
MEETQRHKHGPLRVERSFARSRLEEQIRIRAYELAVPVVCQPMGKSEQQASPGSECESSSHRVAQGGSSP